MYMVVFTAQEMGAGVYAKGTKCGIPHTTLPDRQDCIREARFGDAREIWKA